jgi:hypothetical protein
MWKGSVDAHHQNSARITTKKIFQNHRSLSASLMVTPHFRSLLAATLNVLGATLGGQSLPDWDVCVPDCFFRGHGSPFSGQ